MRNLNRTWKGSEILWLEGSHVSSYLFERRAFAYMAKLSADRVQEYLDKYPGSSQPIECSVNWCFSTMITIWLSFVFVTNLWVP